jgi:hypothetical protein
MALVKDLRRARQLTKTFGCLSDIHFKKTEIMTYREFMDSRGTDKFPGASYNL